MEMPGKFMWIADCFLLDGQSANLKYFIQFPKRTIAWNHQEIREPLNKERKRVFKYGVRYFTLEIYLLIFVKCNI